MKTNRIIKLIVVFFLAFSTTGNFEKANAQVSVNFQVFYDNLSPYGSWIQYPEYGYVWSPSVTGFIPYGTSGHWILTDLGWTWVSDYPWGWAPFHYGSWEYDSFYGWIWIPDNVWGPAWVTWRRGPGYYGWIPRGYRNEYREDHWIFVHDKDVYQTNIYNYHINQSGNAPIIQKTTVIGTKGPDRMEVQKQTAKTVTVVKVQGTDAPGQVYNNDQLKIYKPQISKTDVNGVSPAPKTFKTANQSGEKQQNPKTQEGNGQKSEPNVTVPKKEQQPKQINPKPQTTPNTKSVTPAPKNNSPKQQPEEQPLPKQLPPTVTPQHQNGQPKMNRQGNIQKQEKNHQPRRQKSPKQ